MIVIKVLVQGIVISVISVYALQCCSVHSQEKDFYESLINVARKLREKEIVVALKTMRTSPEVMVIQLKTRQGKKYSRVLCSYKLDSREYTFPEEGKSTSHL